MICDPIPQQAGPGEGADELPLMRAAFRTTVSYGPSKQYEMRFAFPSLEAMQAADREWLCHVAAPLAVEDSRERCASSDAKDAARYRWLREHKPLAIHNACPMLDEEWIDPYARADKVIDAAMAAASSGKEN